MTRPDGGLAARAAAGRDADPDPATRAEACLAAWRFADPAFALDSLLDASRAPDPRVRFAAVYSLGRLGSAGVDASTSVASPARLSDLARRRVRERLVALAASQDAEVRMQAARGLASPDGPQEVSVLGALSQDPDARVRVSAIRSLAAPGASLDPYLRSALKSPDVPVVYAAVEGLGRIGGRSAVDLLVEGIVYEKRTWLREAAMAALVKADPDLAAGIANGISREAEPTLRAAAARALAGRTEARAREIVGQLLKDPDPRVAGAAAESREGVPGSLAETLGASPASADPAVRGAVARVAGARLASATATAADREEALALLERLWGASAKDTLPLAREEVVDAAARAGKDPRAHAIVSMALEDPDRLVRLRAIGQLARVYGEDASARAGAASDRPVEDYVEILRWASRPRAAIVVMRREGYDPGRFTLVLDVRSAPMTARSFADLADRGFFDGLVVHRVVPNFVVQDGDPRGDGNGDAGYSIRDEIGRTRYLTGTLGMASDGKDTAGSQWFVTLSPQPHLDGRYTAFGRVVQNFPGVVLQILPGDRVVSVRTFEGDGTEPLPPLKGPPSGS